MSHLITRKDYIARNNKAYANNTSTRIVHNEYYDQFVNDKTIAHIGIHFRTDELILAHNIDTHLNTIPLRIWDIVAYSMPCNTEFMKHAGEINSKAVRVCIAKRAAGSLIAEALAEENSNAHKTVSAGQ